jgi:hypothetical protein
MFQLNERQLATFRRAAVSDFEEQLVEQCAASSPALAALGRAHLLVAVRAAIARAAGHGFTFAGPVRLFVELGLLFGSAFDTDVQYPWARARLASPEETVATGRGLDQIDRAATLHDASMDALDEIRGADDEHVTAALRSLVDLATLPIPDRIDDLAALALALLEHVHPEKCAFVGEPALRALIAAGTAEATRYGLSAPRDALLLIGLMFALGQGCTADPLHPWIGRILADEAIATPALRARRVEETAMTAARAALAEIDLEA